MTSAVQDVWHALDAAEELPFGLERSALLESLVGEADGLGDEKLALTTRLQLMTSYSYGGEPLRRFPVFSWLLDRFAATPQLFDSADRYRLLWMFKWVTVGVTHHPAVARQRIEARLEEMAEHYAAAGQGPAPVLYCRYQVSAQMDGHEAAENAFQAWIAAPRTPLSDCEACEPGVRVRHLAATGRYADALAEAASVLQLGGCADQPQRTIAHALEPLLQCGFGERAGQEHLRGVRLLRSSGGSPTTWARHIIACARGGRLRRGLDLLEDRLPDLDAAPTPWDAMWLAAAGARLLDGLVAAGDDDLPVAGAATATGAPATVADLLGQLTGSARDLAARFDERNRTAAVGEQVERWLGAPDLPELQLDDVVTRRRATGRDTDTPAVSTSAASCAPTGEADDVTAGDVAALPDRWQAALDGGVATEQAAVLEVWRRARSLPAAAAVPPAAGARLEAALAVEALDGGTVGLHDARGAARLLNETGDAAGALQHELACLRRELVTGGESQDVLARARALVARSTRLEGPAAGCLYLGLAALLQTAGEPIGEAVTRGLAVFDGCDPAALSAVQRGCLALLLRDRAGELEGPQQEELLRRAVGLLGPGERVREKALVTLALGTSLARAGAVLQARELLADAADDAAAAGDPGLAAHAAHALGRVCQAAGDLPAAVEVFRNLASQLGRDGDPLVLAQVRQDLAHTLHESGRPVDAAELAETALDDLEEQLAVRGVTSPDDLDWSALGEAVAAGRYDDLGDDGHRSVPPEQGELAGTLAFTAALFARELGEDAVATGLAQRSAAWHRGCGRWPAEAESLELAAQAGPDPLEAVGMLHRAGELLAHEGRWIAAATCRRGITLPLLQVAGIGAAEQALARAQSALQAMPPAFATSQVERHRLAWEQVALADAAARVLAAAGQLPRALQACEGLDGAFRAVDDARSARDVIALRAQVLEELGRAEECLTELHEAALEARSSGDERQALQLGGYLAAFLDDLGRPDEADAVWKLFTP
jgi:tetratricopeptide (TPR) repeat protein